MAKPTEAPISIRAYAKSLQVDEKAVRRAITEGKIKKGIDKSTGKIITSKANAEWGSIHLVPKPQRGVSRAKAAEKLAAAEPVPVPVIEPPQPEKKGKKAGQTPDMPVDNSDKPFNYQELITSITITADLPYSEALRRKEILGIAKERQLLEEKNGTLIRREDVDKALFKVGDMIKKKIMNTPARCIADIRAAANEVEANNILTTELQAALSDISNLRYNG